MKDKTKYVFPLGRGWAVKRKKDKEFFILTEKKFRSGN